MASEVTSTAEERYENMPFRRCGSSGLHLPLLSLGTWYNFGEAGTGSARITAEAEFHENCREIVHAAFDAGITHIDLANQYGPPVGAAEERIGKIIPDLPREELIVATKAGAKTGPGPYGKGGSRKLLLDSLDASLNRLGVDNVDIFYLHGPDLETSADETWSAMNDAVRSGKTRYLGVSMHRPDAMSRVLEACARNGFERPLVSLMSYNMLNRRAEQDVLPMAATCGFSMAAFCPLGQGLLTGKYLEQIPDDSRANQGTPFFGKEKIDPKTVERLRKLNTIANDRGQSLAQTALAWTLRKPGVATALIGASRASQVRENAEAVKNLAFTKEELDAIDDVFKG